MGACTVTMTGGTLIAVPAALYDQPPALAWVTIGFGFFLLLIGFAWLWKEFERPTLSRTPAWLWDLMAEDEEIRIWVCGKRPLPRRPQ
jgi:hypothetical protein